MIIIMKQSNFTNVMQFSCDDNGGGGGGGGMYHFYPHHSRKWFIFRCACKLCLRVSRVYFKYFVNFIITQAIKCKIYDIGRQTPPRVRFK